MKLRCIEFSGSAFQPIAKRDPELPESLNQTQRTRKAHLLELGLSDFYVGLCFDALGAGLISAGRLSEALLCHERELIDLASIYGRSLLVN